MQQGLHQCQQVTELLGQLLIVITTAVHHVQQYIATKTTLQHCTV